MMVIWLTQRRLSGAAWISTILMLLFLSTPSLHRLEVLEGPVFHIQLRDLQGLYVLLVIGVGAVFWFEPHLRREIADGKLTALILFLVAAAAFLMIQLHPANQPERLLDYALTLWIVFVHTAALGALAVYITLTTAQHGARLTRAAIGLAVVGIVALIVVHIASVGRFMYLDMPDESWFASQAWYFAQTGTLGAPLANNAYGVPDSVSPRIYQLMGYWIRLFGDSLTAMRSFSLVAAGIGVAIVGVMLARARELTTLGKAAAFASLLTFALIVRTSHNLRPDTGLIIYGALALVGLRLLLRAFDHEAAGETVPPRLRWIGAGIAGAGLYIGLESVPTGSLIFGVLVGLAIVFTSLPRRDWRSVALYTAVCALACLLYVATHFGDNPQVSINAYQQYTTLYTNAGMLGVNPALEPFVWLIRFSVTLVPLELITMVIAVMIGLSSRERIDRTIALLVVAVLVLMPVIVNTAFTYFVLIMPMLAYLIARACRFRIVGWVFVFAVLPSLISAPLHDMTYDITENLNVRRLAELDLLTWRIPENSVVIADETFWFTLRENRQMLNWYGIAWYARTQGVAIPDAADMIGVTIAVCESINVERRCERLPDFEYAYEFVITDSIYFIYERRTDE